MGKKNEEENGFDDEEMTVTLDLEDGQSVTCAIIVILTVEERDYIVLLPLDENGENQDGDVWIYRYFEDENDGNAEPTLEYIEDDGEYQKAADAFAVYLAETDHDEIIETEE